MKELEVAFGPGARTATLTVPTEDETVNDGNSRFKARILLDTTYGISPYPGLAHVWVRDDDIPTVTITPEFLEHYENQDESSPKYTFHRTGDASSYLEFFVELQGTIYWPPRFGNITFSSSHGRPGVDGRFIWPGQSSREYPFGFLGQVGPLGGVGRAELLPFYCESTPGDCGYRPQYRVGSSDSFSVTAYNIFQGVRVEAGQSSVMEGETVTFTLTRYGATPNTRAYRLTVQLEVTQDGDVISGSAPQTVTFAGFPDTTAANSVLTATITIPTIDDTVYEDDGAVTLRILPPDDDNVNQYEVANNFLETATVAVTDNDLPGISISDAEAGEGDGSLEFTVSVEANDREIGVAWATADGAGANAATAGSDYEAASGVLAFAPGETSKTITVTALDDGLDEFDETFTVNLSEPSEAVLVTAAGTGTIRDDDEGEAVVTLRARPSREEVEEGESADFLLERAPAGGGFPLGFAGFPLTVNLSVVQECDFIADRPSTFAATATFPAGHHYTALQLATEDDEEQEPNGSVTVAVVDGLGYSVGDPGQGTVNVMDNDLRISIADAAPQGEDSGPLTFTVSLSGASGETVTVDVSTVDGEATSADAASGTSLGKDFEAKSETLSFAPGETEKRFSVTLVDDTLDEKHESLTVELSNPSANAHLEDASATGEIRDNDQKMIVGVYRDGRRVSEDEDAPVAFYFELLSAPGSGTTGVERQTAVRWRVTPGSAKPGEDYVERTGSTVIPMGGLTGVVGISLLDDDLFEQRFETFTFEITGALDLDVDEARKSIEIKHPGQRDNAGRRCGRLGLRGRGRRGRLHRIAHRSSEHGPGGGDLRRERYCRVGGLYRAQRHADHTRRRTVRLICDYDADGQPAGPGRNDRGDPGPRNVGRPGSARFAGGRIDHHPGPGWTDGVHYACPGDGRRPAGVHHKPVRSDRGNRPRDVGNSRRGWAVLGCP